MAQGKLAHMQLFMCILPLMHRVMMYIVSYSCLALKALVIVIYFLHHIFNICKLSGFIIQLQSLDNQSTFLASPFAILEQNLEMEHTPPSVEVFNNLILCEYQEC